MQPDHVLSQSHAHRGIAVVDRSREPGAACKQQIAVGARLGIAEMQVRTDQHAARADESLERAQIARRGCEPVEESEIVSGSQCRQHVGEVALMHADAIGDAERREILTREARVDPIEFNVSMLASLAPWPNHSAV